MVWTDIFAAWGTANDEDWQTLVNEIAVEDVAYADPHSGSVQGRDALIGVIAQFREMMPDGSAVARGGDGYDGRARSAVDFLKGGNPMMTGQYFAELDPKGRITRLTGFPSAPTL